MSELHITNLPDKLRNKMERYIRKEKGIRKKGDIREFVIEAIKEKLKLNVSNEYLENAVREAYKE